MNFFPFGTLEFELEKEKKNFSKRFLFYFEYMRFQGSKNYYYEEEGKKKLNFCCSFQTKKNLI